jgi:hypothetical protein
MGTNDVELVCNVREIAERSTEPIQPRHNKRITLHQHLKGELQLSAAVAFRAGALFLDDDGAMVPLKSGLLIARS